MTENGGGAIPPEIAYAEGSMDELKKNQRYTAEITGYSSTGTGVCRILGRAVFVDFALPGEVWEVVILKVTASAVYGRGDRLIVPSPARVDPACPVFGKCGGCGLMHMDYDEELRFKLDRANNALRHLAGLDFTLDGIAGADEAQVLRYRNKAIFAVGRADDGRALTGFFRERSHSLIPAPDCLIQTALSVRCAAALRAFMDVSGVSAYDESAGKGLIRHIFVRCSLNYPQAVACVVAADRLGGQRSAALAAALRAACPELTGIALCVNRTRGNTVLAGDLHALWGNEFIEDTL
ncbi:MAG: TRAM domain-containing protein, partial [Oscillospiraceae bacterium]|nr:TRAM domain-containing protein [Oscillospiraceae bacterium]